TGTRSASCARSRARTSRTPRCTSRATAASFLPRPDELIEDLVDGRDPRDVQGQYPETRLVQLGVAGRARVGGDDDLEPHVGGVTGGVLDRRVRRHARDDEPLDAERTQDGLEVGAVERVDA